MTLQSHPRSLILARIESACETSHWCSIVTLVLSCPVSEILELLYAKSHFFYTPPPILTKISGVSFGIDLSCWGLQERSPWAYLALRSSGPWQDNGSKSSPSAPVCSHSPDAVPVYSSIHQGLFKCGPPRLRWTTSSSAATTRGPRHGMIGWSSRWHPDNMTCHPKSSLCYNVL